MGFKCQLDLERPLLGIEHEEKKSKAFSSTFGEEALLLDGFLRDRFAQPRNQSQSFCEKPDLQTPRFMVISERLTNKVIDRQTDRQTDRKTIKALWNLQDTTYPFCSKCYSNGEGRHILRILQQCTHAMLDA